MEPRNEGLLCEHGHLQYGEEELEACDHKCERTVSLDDLDSSAHDFWNLTLDDLDVSQPSVHSRQMRRRSDGMEPMAATLQGQQKKSRKKALPSRNVSFGKVQVRSHERVLGDNPSCHDGPSLSIGWNYGKEKIVQLDDFEKKRSKERRTYQKLQLSAEKREKIAKRNGFSKKEIQENVELMAKYQRRRERTRKEVEKDEMAELLSLSKQKTLARFLQERSRSSRRSSTGASSMRSI